MTSRRRPAIGAAFLVSALLAACTPSVSPSAPADPFAEPIVPKASLEESGSADSGALGAPAPEKGSGTLVLAVLPGVLVPGGLAEAFRGTTGFTLETLAVDSASALASLRADAVLGLGLVDLPEAESALAPAPFTITAPDGVPALDTAIAYGRDDVCVLADRGWMSANRRTAPSGLDALAKAESAALLAIPDPADSSAARTFLLGASQALGEGLGEWAKSLASGGALIAPATEVEAAFTALESGASASATRPLAVAPMSVIARAATTPGAESRAAALDATCAERYLYAAVLAGGEERAAASFLAWIDSSEGQAILASSGAAFPLDADAAEDTPAAWFLQAAPDARRITPEEAARAAEVADTWRAGLSG